MKSFQNIIELCLLMCIIIFNYGVSSTSLKQPPSQLMPLDDVEEPKHTSLEHLAHVKGEIVSFQRVRETTFTQVPVGVPANASLISKHWDTIANENSSKEIILFQQSVKGGGCKIRYRDDTQGCVFCTRSAKCPAGWTYHTWRSCGFGGCQSTCYQQYDCPTPAPTTISPTSSPTTLSPTRAPTFAPTPVPTQSPTWSPSAAPTFAAFSIPHETNRRTSFVGFTGEFYIINEFSGMVIEQDILNVKQCSRVIDDTQGCVFCTRSSKCPAGSSYKTWRHCGFMGCQSMCTQHYDCPDPFEVLYMDFIKSSKDISNNQIPQHSQLWHFNEDHNSIITSVNDWVIQAPDDDVVAAATTFSSAYDLSYDPVNRTIRLSQHNRFLCIGEDKIRLTTCENSDLATSRWIFKTPEEAFPHEFGVIGKYYIANKETDLVVEQTFTQEGYPLTTWIPDGSSGQLWYSDSHGRIRHDDYIIEAVDVVVIKYKIPDVPIGESFAVSIPNHPDQILVMTPELWHFRGSIHYLLPGISSESNGLMSTSRIQDEDDALEYWNLRRDKQQWDLIAGQLVNGMNNQKLAIHDHNGSRIGVECRLEDDTTDEFYLIPEAMIVSWIDLVAMKKLKVSYFREEVLFYQKMAAFHISTIIGLSPEELIARANLFQSFINEGVVEWRKHNKDALIGNIAATSVDLVGSVAKVIGLALMGVTWGTSAIFYFVGQTLTLSAAATRKLNEMNHNERIRAEDHLETILYEIQGSVVAGSNALASFLDDFTASMKRLEEYNKTPEGKKELQAMEEYVDTIAIDVGYSDSELFKRDLFRFGSKAYNWYNQYINIPSQMGSLVSTVYMLGTSSSLTGPELFDIVSLGSSQTFGIVTEVFWIFYELGSITYNSIELHKNDKLGDEMVKGAAAIQENTLKMYQHLNMFIGDVEDLRDMSAVVPKSEMFFTNDELNDKWRTLMDLGKGKLDNPVYGRLTDTNWYQGCEHIPCARLD